MADPDGAGLVERSVPAPKENLTANFTTWAAGKPIYRIHSSRFTATQFNSGLGSTKWLHADAAYSAHDLILLITSIKNGGITL